MTDVDDAPNGHEEQARDVPYDPEHDVANPEVVSTGIAGAEPAVTVRRRPDRGLLIASLVIAGGLMLIIWGLSTGITGDDGVDRPAEIESISPVENAVQVLQQERIAVDLEFGYEARLIIDGVVLETTNINELKAKPGELLVLPATAIFDPGSSVISFQPVDGALITEFTQGRHLARVEYWLSADGPENARSYNWSFVVV